MWYVIFLPKTLSPIPPVSNSETPTSSSNSSHTPETSETLLPSYSSACSPHPTATSNPKKPQLQSPLSLPPACSTCHSSLPRTSYSEPRHHGYSSFLNFPNPRKLFSTENIPMTPLASLSPLLKSLSKDISNAFTTPKKLRKRKKICYSELDGSFN